MRERKHIPQITQLEDIGTDRLYRTRFYGKLTAKSKEAWKQFRTLAKHARQAHESYHGFNQRPVQATEINAKFLYLVEDESLGIPER